MHWLGFILIVSVLLILQSVGYDGAEAGCHTPFYAPSQLPNPLPAEITAAFNKIEKVMKAQVASGLLSDAYVAITYKQNVIFSQGFGLVRSASNPNVSSVPTDRTIYALDSITKTFTALLMMIFRDAGIVSLDANVASYLPGLHISDPAYPSSRSFITARQLSSHLSGLPRNTPCWNGSSAQPCPFDTQTMLERINGLPLTLPPYTVPSYSNLGFSLLGHALAAAATSDPNPTTEAYQTLILKYITAPLGLVDTVFNLTPEQISRVAFTALQPPNFQFGWDQPAGGLWGTPADQLTYLQWLLTYQEVYSATPSPVLDRWSIREWITQPLFVLSGGKSSQGMPWENSLRSGQWTYSKAGTGPGYTSEMWLAPALGLGVTVLTASNRAPEVVRETIDILFPAVDQYLSQLLPPALLPPDYEIFLGTYKTASNEFTWVLRNESGIAFIALDIHEPPFPMLHLRERNATTATFQAMPYPAQVQGGCLELEGGLLFEFLYFQLNEQGTGVLSFTIPGVMYGQTAVKTN